MRPLAVCVALVCALVICSVPCALMAQDTQSVLVNPPAPQQQTVTPETVIAPAPVVVFARPWLGWRLRPWRPVVAAPVVPVIVQPVRILRPRVIWQPTVILE